LKTPEEIIELLDTYVFHDMPVESIAFKTMYHTQLLVHLSVYNEETKDYDDLKITFKDIIQLNSDAITLNTKSDFELFSFDYEYTDVYTCELMFLCGFGEPSLAIEFTCKTIEINQ